MVSKLKPDSGFSDMVTLQVPHVQFSAGQPFPLYIHVHCWQKTAVLQRCQPFKASPGYKKTYNPRFLLIPLPLPGPRCSVLTFLWASSNQDLPWENPNGARA